MLSIIELQRHREHYFIGFERLRKEVISKITKSHAGTIGCANNRLKEVISEAFVPLILWLLPAVVHADITLGHWRQQLPETCKLADNKLEQAYTSARYLQTALPTNINPIERIRVLNLLTRTEVYLAEIELAVEHTQQALNQAKKHNDRVGHIEAPLNIATNAVNREQIETLVSVTISSLELLQGIECPELLSEVMLRIMTSYFRLNLSDKAITLAVQNEDIARQSDKLNLQEKLQAAEIQNQKMDSKMIWSILIASIILLLCSIWFSITLRRTNLKLSELNSELRKSQSKLQATLDAIPDLLFVLARDGTYLEFHSPIASHFLYVPAGQLLGKKISDVLPKDEAAIYLQAIEEAREHGLSTGKQVPLILADGLHWFELSVARKATMLGDPEKFICVSRNITERKKIEQVLSTSEQQFRALVEHSPDIVVRYDADGRRLYINPALEVLLGVPAETLIGTTLTEWSMDNFESEYQHLKHVLSTGQEARFMMRVNNDDGYEYFGDIRFVPEFDAKGKVISVLAIGRDITTLKQAERELEKAHSRLRELVVHREELLEEERRRIARDMHDELGQYLTTLRMNVSVLHMQYGMAHQEMDKRLQSMKALLDQTIQVVRQIALQLRPPQLEMSGTAALEWLVEDFSLTNGVACELITNCDEEQMSDNLAITLFRIVQESLTNAARYAHASQVKVSLHKEANGYYLCIRDNGVGFESEAQQSKSFGLLGIRERVASHGGESKIISSRGKGTIIEVFLPK